MLLPLAPAVHFLEQSNVQVRSVEILKRNGYEVYTIMGKENGKVSTFQLNGRELLYFDRSKKEVQEKVIKKFNHYDSSRKDAMKNAVSGE